MALDQILLLPGFGGAEAPAQFSNLILWMRADSGISVGDGEPVPSWTSRDSSQSPATQGTGTKQPDLVINGLNGKPVVRFDGTDDSLSFGDLAALDLGSSNFTIFIVASCEANDDVIFAKDNFSGSGNGLLIYRGSNQFRYWPTVSPINIGAADAERHILEIVREGTGAGQLKTWLNGTAGGTGQDARTLSNSLNAVIGSSATAEAAQHMTGDVAEIICYNTNHSAANRLTVRQYLADRYGKTLP